MDPRLLPAQKQSDQRNSTHFGLGDDLYPVSFEVFHGHLSAMLARLREASMNSDGRLPRCGLERSAYDKLFTQEGTVATPYPIRDTPDSFDQEATSNDK